VVGFEHRLLHHGLAAGGCNWFSRPEPDAVVTARIRHRGAFIPCRVGPGDPAQVEFLEPARAVSPGQAVVFYSGDVVLGGGTILRMAQRPTDAPALEAS
jgi:tRNA-specific 2-thiouridylase